MLPAETSPPAPPRTWPAMTIEQAHARLTAPGVLFEMEKLEIEGRARPRLEERADILARSCSTRRRPSAGASSWSTRTSASATRPSPAPPWPSPRPWSRRASRAATAWRSSCATCRNGSSPSSGEALAGAIVAPLNAWWPAGELVYGLNDSGKAVAVFFDAERFERLRAHLYECAGLRRVYVCRGEADGEAERGVEALEQA